MRIDKPTSRDPVISFALHIVPYTIGSCKLHFGIREQLKCVHVTVKVHRDFRTILTLKCGSDFKRVQTE